VLGDPRQHPAGHLLVNLMRQAAPPTMCIRKYRPGGTDGAPIFAA
jgi:hypothetical protein